jgi:hypothetical protein
MWLPWLQLALLLSAAGAEPPAHASCPISGVAAHVGESAEVGLATVDGLGLSGAGFLEMVKAHTPVVITGVAREWPATARWTSRYLKKKAGKVSIEVEAGADKYFHALWNEKSRTMTVADYLRRRKVRPGRGGALLAFFIVQVPMGVRVRRALDGLF